MTPIRTLRATLRHASVLLVLAASALFSHAADPRSPPGWYSPQIGRFTVTALWDGTLDFPADKSFARLGPSKVKSLLARAYLSPTIPLPVNAFIIDTGQRVVMIDAGTGTSRMFGDGLGKVQANLRAAGYTPEQIDEIYLTHMHTDHAGGLTVEGRAVFPNAVVRADAREAGYFLNPQEMAAHPDAKEDFESAMAMLEPYVTSGRFRPFEGRTQLVAGVHAQPAWGHTPGHTAYVVESDGEKLVLWGDLMHVAAVQFPIPSATVTFDAVPAQSAAVRAQVYREAAREGAWIAAAHVGFPGIGKLRENPGGAYTWVPISLVRGR